ncbi:hypothetical protein SAMN02745166_01086 [Prosthecobacter debontii]|uniref:Uncharacterized protein n=1 Tax=Prosthecobacter debontii TaxID=48467 RepID=A0A1T4X5V3_9BACT|nr:hypothetical protein [Prosthecobacter debontii]SKA85013.1 hypothetical protein SAMN02745166_01086 [Prosthecobacter debontii]
MPAALYASYAGGMNAAAENPRNLRTEQLRLLVNGTVRTGWAAPRPPFKAREMLWMDVRAQSLWETGVCQGVGVFNSTFGSCLVFAFDGRLLRLDLETMRISHVYPEGTDSSKPLFNPKLPFVFFEQRAGWLVVQDGTSRPVLVNQTAILQQPIEVGMMRTGTLMADGWGRLAVADHGRRRIYFSDHEFDPSSGPLAFTEANAYFKNARFFEVPATLGRIMAMAFGPALNGNDDKGALLVFCESGTRAYNVSIPRDQWITSDIGATILPKVGACAHRAVVARGNDVIFSDHNGRIQSMASAISRQQDARIDPIDAEVWDLYRTEDATLRAHRYAVEFDDRVLTTVQPERIRRFDGRHHVRHRGLVVLQNDAVIPVEPVWDGLWTGVFPVCMATARVGGRPRCFILSFDSDHRHRLYELGVEIGHDLAPAPKATPMIASLRPTDLDNPFRSKPIAGVSMRLGDARGLVKIKGWWQVDRGATQTWFNHSLQSPACLGFSDCGIQLPAPSQSARINLPRPEHPDFFEASPIFEITGLATLQEVAIETGEPKSDPNTPNVTGCSDPEPLAADYTCRMDLFSYDLQKAPPTAL